MRGCGGEQIIECGVRGEQKKNVGPGRPDIVNQGSGESGYSECRSGRADIVNAGFRGERI
ncbi:unnamed protein product [Staurois parvus]|uniref:Uncharacterized protein n=1 Tax=Staurois parvus TaxID=386267 RepID=A0ABN9GF76_9NEOB|nr:unnamed protein product [Staurois parvus]